MASRESPVAFSVWSVRPRWPPAMAGWSYRPRAEGAVYGVHTSLHGRQVRGQLAPAVSWVCRWTGWSNLSRRAPMRMRAAGARNSPPCPLCTGRALPLGRVVPLCASNNRACRAARTGWRGRPCSRPPLGHLSGLEHGADGGQHLVDIVQGVENLKISTPVRAASLTNAKATSSG